MADRAWAVVDVETTGLDPAAGRMISIAVVTLSAGGDVEQRFAALLNPGTGPGSDPGSTAHVHGLTAGDLDHAPTFADVAAELAQLLAGRTLVAHYAAFDHGFLAAEVIRAGVALPVGSVLCTVELAELLDLPVENRKLATLAAHWGIAQHRPHDAIDDARVLAELLPRLLECAEAVGVELPIRAPVSATMVNQNCDER